MVGRAPEGSRIPVPCAWIRPIHPIPRVILAPGIKAIADSRIAASCKKFAIQVDPTRCLPLLSLPQLVVYLVERVLYFSFSRFRVSSSVQLLFHLIREDGALDHIRPPRRDGDDPDDGV